MLQQRGRERAVLAVAVVCGRTRLGGKCNQRVGYQRDALLRKTRHDPNHRDPQGARNYRREAHGACLPLLTRAVTIARLPNLLRQPTPDTVAADLSVPSACCCSALPAARTGRGPEFTGDTVTVIGGGAAPRSRSGRAPATGPIPIIQKSGWSALGRPIHSPS